MAHGAFTPRRPTAVSSISLPPPLLSPAAALCKPICRKITPWWHLSLLRPELVRVYNHVARSSTRRFPRRSLGFGVPALSLHLSPSIVPREPVRARGYKSIRSPCPLDSDDSRPRDPINSDASKRMLRMDRSVLLPSPHLSEKKIVIQEIRARYSRLLSLFSIIRHRDHPSSLRRI